MAKILSDLILVVGLIFNLVASLLMAYGRIFKSKDDKKLNLLLKEITISMKKNID